MCNMRYLTKIKIKDDAGNYIDEVLNAFGGVHNFKTYRT